MKASLLALFAALLTQAPQTGPARAANQADPPGKSAYFAFVGRDYIFTLEMVEPGVPILNFVCMTDDEGILPAKQIRLTLENRKALGNLFLVDTGDPKQPLIVPSLRVRPRSSFGVRIQGDFGNEREILGVTVKFGKEEFQLVPLTSFEFENLALKVNRINLGSPDFRDDWRVLKLETMGSRRPAGRW